jgi:hypothetical protein
MVQLVTLPVTFILIQSLRESLLSSRARFMFAELTSRAKRKFSFSVVNHDAAMCRDVIVECRWRLRFRRSCRFPATGRRRRRPALSNVT